MTGDLEAQHNRVFAVPLFARSAASAGIAIYVLRAPPHWTDIVRAVAWYALTDGILGVVVGILLAWRNVAARFPVLTAMTFADALIRIALGIVLVAAPGITEVPMTLVPFFGAVGSMAAVLGLAALVLWTVAHHRLHPQHRRGMGALFDPLATIGFLAMGVGGVLFFHPPTTAETLRDMIAAAGIVLAASFAVSAFGALLSAGRGPSGTAER